MQPRVSLLAAGTLLSALAAAPALAEGVIVKCQRPCAAAVSAVEKGGGQVTYRYRYVSAIAAEVPDPGLASLRAVVGPGAVRKDLIVAQPTVAFDRRAGKSLLAEAEPDSASELGAADLAKLAAAGPSAYLINNTFMNLDPLLAAGLAGQGQKVAVIDSGIRPGFPHISLDGSVIGGEDLVGDGMGYSNFGNDGHGTFVAGMISANVEFTFSGAFLNTVKAYCPSCVVGGNRIPMVGSAPLSSLYALRVFGPTGGAPESRIIAAMERVLELRESYDNGAPERRHPDGSYSALDITVCNMSLGGATLYAGRDIEDELTQAFLEHDIVLVTSAGNAGPSGITGGSPGTGFGSLTVGASSSAVHERILRDLQLGPGVGALYRPFGATQTAYFSSRGPTADGRSDPDLVANGFGSYGQGFASSIYGISIASGTSFSSPSVAGVAAVLRQAAPLATAREVRNALIATANPALVGDGSGPLDRGAGLVDAAAALELLEAGNPSDAPGATGGTNPNVKVNILQGVGLKTYDGNVTRSAKGLLPGERFDTCYRVHPNTSAVVVRLSGVKRGTVQNGLFGDDILLTVHSAKTSAIGEGDYPVFEFTTGGTYVIPAPELGLMRVTLNGDWTNASPIDATVNIFSVTDPVPRFTTQGPLDEGQVRVIPFAVPAGAAKLEVRLEWRGDWAGYPANDFDLILVRPDGTANVDGATLNNPEAVVEDGPAAGDWYAIVDGYSISTKEGDRFQLRIAVDGEVLK